jgi:O-antigen/teichoic acid export membrane protein
MSVRKSLAWSYGSQAFTFVVMFGSSVVVARLLSPREVGVYAIAMAAAGILAVFTSFSIQTYIIREGELTQGLLRSVYSVNLMMNLLLALLTATAGWVEMFVFEKHDVGAVLLLASLGPILGIFEFVPGALYQREMNYGVLSRVGMVKTVISSATVVSCAFSGFGSLSPAIGPLVAGTFSVIYYNIRRRRDVVFRPTRRGLKPIIIFGFQIMSISGVAQIAQRMTDIILGSMLGLTALGMYSRASNLSGMIFSNVYGQATGVIFVKLSNDLRDKGTVHETFVQSMKLITCIMWPLLIGIAVLSRPMIHILYGDKWLDAALPLSLLMVAQFVVLGFGMNWELFVLRRETALQTRYEMLRAIATLVVVTIGCLFSIAGAAAGRVAEAVLGYFLYRPHMDRMAGTTKGELERVYGESLLLTVVAVAPAFVLMMLSGWAADTSFVFVGGSVLLGIAAWFAVMVVRRHPAVDELQKLVSGIKAMRSRSTPA